MRIIDAQKWECVSSKQYSEACQKSYLPILVKMKNQGVRFYVQGVVVILCFFQAFAPLPKGKPEKKNVLKIHHFEGSRKFRLRAAVKLFPCLTFSSNDTETNVFQVKFIH